MGDLIESLGLDWRFIVGQSINFLALLLILTIFTYKPLLRTLNKRRKMIEKSMEQKQEIEQQLEDIREYHKEQMIQARNEAQVILTTAQENAEKERSVQLVKAQKEINALFEKANKDIDAQKQEMLKNVEARIAEILIPALERVLQESVDEKTRQQLQERSIQKINEMYQKS